MNFPYPGQFCVETFKCYVIRARRDDVHGQVAGEFVWGTVEMYSHGSVLLPSDIPEVLAYSGCHHVGGLTDVLYIASEACDEVDGVGGLAIECS